MGTKKYEDVDDPTGESLDVIADPDCDHVRFVANTGEDWRRRKGVGFISVHLSRVDTLDLIETLTNWADNK